MLPLGASTAAAATSVTAVQPGPSAQPSQRLKSAAHEFEASLMKEFLQPLQHDALFDEGTDENSSEGSGSALMSFGSEALAKAISERGGFGIATKIIDHFGAVSGAAGRADHQI